MQKKWISIFILLGFIALSLAVFKNDLKSFCFFNLYKKQLDIVIENLRLIVTGDMDSIESRAMSCQVLIPSYFKEYGVILRKRKIESMKVSFASLKNHKGIDHFYTVIYFEYDTKAQIYITLKKMNEKWLMVQFGMTEDFWPIWPVPNINEQ